MKTKIILAAIASVLALGAIAPSKANADACRPSGYYVTRVVGYDHCGKPIYKKVWVSSSRSHGHGHGGGHNHGGGRGGHIHAPGIDIHFGSSGHRHHHGR